MKHSIGILMVIGLLAGCGDDDDAGSDGGSDAASAATSFACENGTSADQMRHACSDFVYTNIPTGLFETAKTQGTAIATARVIARCDRTGAVGGCTNTTTTNGITTVTTTWQYSGTPASA